MASRALRFPGLRLTLEEKAEETIVYCSGKLTSDSAEVFQSEIADHVIPVSRGKGLAVTNRIVLDLSNVTFVDGTGLRALFILWTAAQKTACELVIVNFNVEVRELVSRAKLDQVFSWIKSWSSRHESTE
jgi:anti-anti-sigma factor